MHDIYIYKIGKATVLSELEGKFDLKPSKCSLIS